MTEVVLFGLVGLLALAAAFAMLLSDNPVHSALFLIVVMGCVAFLFLLLNAPFLAMIQVTVYTGAIMVLFLFVIMLLGAERLQAAETTKNPPRFPWYVPLAVGFVFALAVIVGLTLLQVNLDLAPAPGAAPQIRVVNAAQATGSIDVYAGDTKIVSGVAFDQTPSYVTLQPGNYTIKVQPTSGTPATTDVTLKSGTAQTLVTYGDPNKLTLSLVSDDNSAINEAQSARFAFFNATSAPVQVADLGSELNPNDTRVLVDNLAPGQASSALIEPEGTFDWAFVDPNNPNTVIAPLNKYVVNSDTSGLIVLTTQSLFTGAANATVAPTAIPVVIPALPSFGGPQAIGLQLFTNYMLVFQLLAVLLLAALVGAIVLTHRQAHVTGRVSGRRRVVSRPLVNVIASQVGHEVTSEGTPELQEPAANTSRVGE